MSTGIKDLINLVPYHSKYINTI